MIEPSDLSAENEPLELPIELLTICVYPVLVLPEGALKLSAVAPQETTEPSVLSAAKALFVLAIWIYPVPVGPFVPPLVLPHTLMEPSAFKAA